MCAEGEDEVAQGLQLMSVVVDNPSVQVTPPASLDCMPAMQAAAGMAPAPASTGYVDFEGGGGTYVAEALPVATAPLQLFNVSPTRQGAGDGGVISDDSEDDT
jgi:hypothetical protein